MKAWLKWRNISLRLVWDLFMVWVALINLSLILFDLSYFMLRPVYFQYLPLITRIYDPVKGVEPHPLTSQLADEADAARQLLALDPSSRRLAENIDHLEVLTKRVLTENPFERSGQSANLEVIRLVIAQETGHPTADMKLDKEITAAVHDFWNAEPALLRHRLDLFSARIEPKLRVNYHREFGYGGHMVDHFWIIDLPFLILFWIEFLVRWILALKRKTYARWFFFPIFNWYDLLGLIPTAYFRVFRLLRAVSMYMRLRQSKLSQVGKDAISRGVAYISNIITEEISDMVSLRILNEYQEEIRDGTHRRIIDATIGSRRDQIEEILARQARQMLTDPDTTESLRHLLRLNLDTAVEQSEALKSVPLPSAVVKPMVRSIGEVILDTTLETITMTLHSSEGQQTLRDLVANVVEQLLSGPGLEEVEEISRVITLDVLEHMKEAVAVRKWALPKKPAVPAELGEGEA